MKTVKDFFENIEDKEELIFLGGGSGFIFCGTAEEWAQYSEQLSETRLLKLEQSFKATQSAFNLALKRYLNAKAELDKFRVFDHRLVTEEYESTTGKHCVLFEGDDPGEFWTRDEFLRYMETGEFPTEKKSKAKKEK